MKVIVVGGGFAGVKTALELVNKSGIEVTLISRNADFEYHGSLYRSATGHTPLEVVIRLGEIFANAKNVEVVIDNIVALSPTTKYIKGGTGRQYAYDVLVLAMGNEKNYFNIPGMDIYAHSIYTMHDTIALRSALVNIFADSHRKKLRVAVIGAGPSGVELAAELDHFSRLVAEKYEVHNKSLAVDLIDGNSRVLPTLNEHASRKALRRLQDLGVNVLLNQKVLACSRHTLKLESGLRTADVIIWTAGSRPVDLFMKYPSVFSIEHGRVHVDEYLRVPNHTDIYVLGDNAATLYSGMAQTAIFDAMYAAKSIIALSKGKKLARYIPKLPLYIVPVGGRWAVMQTKRNARSGPYAWMMRRRGDLFVYKNFKPIREAYKLWRRGSRMAAF